MAVVAVENHSFQVESLFAGAESLFAGAESLFAGAESLFAEVEIQTYFDLENL
jgi:hypothetical protein